MKNLVLMIAVMTLVYLSGCSEINQFQYGSIRQALDDAVPDGGDADILDVNGDGIPDAIDTDGDGDPDTTFDPPDTSGGDDAPIRDEDSGDCVILGSTKYFSLNSSASLTAASLGNNQNLWIKLASNSITVSIDLTGAASLKRIIVTHTGNSNTVTVANSAMAHGFCNESLAGGSNVETLEVSNSAKIVDLQAASGNNNTLNVQFTPAPTGLKYMLSGATTNCVTFVGGTTIVSGSSPPDMGNTTVCAN